MSNSIYLIKHFVVVGNDDVFIHLGLKLKRDHTLTTRIGKEIT